MTASYQTGARAAHQAAWVRFPTRPARERLTRQPGCAPPGRARGPQLRRHPYARPAPGCHPVV